MNSASSNPQPADRKEPRYLASTGRRRGRRLRAGKQGLMDTILPRVQIPAEFFVNPVTSEQLYGLFPSGMESLFFEIGFGTGTHLAHQAELYPHTGIIGCEPYIHGVGDLLRAIDENKLENVRVHDGDARDLLEKIPDAVLNKVFILYPDPWPKTRHHKRRLISQPFLAMLARVMKPGAELRLATDDQDYCTWMLEQLTVSPDFCWQAKRAHDWKTPPHDWVTTRYEQKALSEGRVPNYLNFTRL